MLFDENWKRVETKKQPLLARYLISIKCWRFTNLKSALSIVYSLSAQADFKAGKPSRWPVKYWTHPLVLHVSSPHVGLALTMHYARVYARVARVHARVSKPSRPAVCLESLNSVQWCNVYRPEYVICGPGFGVFHGFIANTNTGASIIRYS